MFWKGSGESVGKAEVKLYDPFSNLERFVAMTHASEEGKYFFRDLEHREAIDIDATLDGRQFLVGVTRNGESVSRRISDISTSTSVDLYLQGLGVLDLELVSGNTAFSYGMISGSVDSFFIFSVDLPLSRTVNVLAEHPDSIRIALYDSQEELIEVRTEQFTMKNNQILPLKLDL